MGWDINYHPISEKQKNEWYFDVFDKTHGYYIAVVQGFFQKFFYTRGSALSFFRECHFRQDIVPSEKLTKEV